MDKDITSHYEILTMDTLSLVGASPVFEVYYWGKSWVTQQLLRHPQQKTTTATWIYRN
jgi:hypothetical protein